MPIEKVPWPHAPLHQLGQSGVYFVTARTYQKAHHFRDRKRLDVLQRGLLKLAAEHGWKLEAWAMFSNHYHFIGHSPADQPTAESLAVMLKNLHEETSKWVNRLDDSAGRKVWFNYRETRLTYQRSYFARLNYVHQNPVRHGLVAVANQYPWCSAAWFERTVSPATVKSIYRFGIQQVRVDDDFEPVMDCD